MSARSEPVVVCADVGSTYTKAAVVDLDGGRLVAAASAPTTVGTDVLHGLDAAVGAATASAGVAEVPWYVCSSAGVGCAWRWWVTSRW